MNVLMITGDRNLLVSGTEASRRLELQRAACERLEVVFWGRSSLWPKIPEGPFDIVTAQDPFWRGLFAWFVARRLGAVFNVQVHADLDRQPPVKHILGQIVLRHADCIRVVSEKLKARIEKFGVRAPISVLPIFVDIARFRAAARKSHEGKIILWVGRFEEEKNPLYALSVLREVRKAGIGAHLIMLGTGSLEPDLRKQADKLLVEFPGWKDPLPYLQIADVVLSTSKHESWGASIVEALAAGVPVVALDVGVAREAGAIIAMREEMVSKVIEILKSGEKGELKLDLPTAEEWARQWYAGLEECDKK